MAPRLASRPSAVHAVSRGSSSSDTALPDTGDCPRGRVVFEKLQLASRDAKEARGFAAISFYSLTKNRKLKTRRTDRRTKRLDPSKTAGIAGRAHHEAPRPLTCSARPRRPGNRGLTLGLPTPARLTRRRRPPLPRSGVWRSLGGTRARVEPSGRRRGGSGQEGPQWLETRWFSAEWGCAPPAPRLYLCHSRTQKQKEAPGAGPRPPGAAQS